MISTTVTRLSPFKSSSLQVTHPRFEIKINNVSIICCFIFTFIEQNISIDPVPKSSCVYIVIAWVSFMCLRPIYLSNISKISKKTKGLFAVLFTLSYKDSIKNEWTKDIDNWGIASKIWLTPQRWSNHRRTEFNYSEYLIPTVGS